MLLVKLALIQQKATNESEKINHVSFYISFEIGKAKAIMQKESKLRSNQEKRIQENLFKKQIEPE